MKKVMFIISFKRAADLADAMEARGYIPGEKRTKLVEMKFTIKDVIYLFIMVLLIAFIIGPILIIGYISVIFYPVGEILVILEKSFAGRTPVRIPHCGE